MPANIRDKNSTAGMSSLLDKHYLGTFKLRLSNITCTEMVRPLSEKGLQRLQRSIREVGWLEQFAPSVVIQRDRLGDEGKLTAEIVLKIPARTLDGAHRISALQRQFDPDTAITMRVYMEFNQADERLIANGEFSSALVAVSVGRQRQRADFCTELRRCLAVALAEWSVHKWSGVSVFLLSCPFFMLAQAPVSLCSSTAVSQQVFVDL